ncbi:clathrin heavy chain-like [Paramacrobiotus metropolitanus]|uniref:clathrin heavy chain-like n=1 Tax=Paramacrobiotus metropolitanus TaxID=2943436 RepID=UPI0024462C41|nr:clathrin heavy chain-like [Paramacrobiotus metropolitanus]
MSTIHRLFSFRTVNGLPVQLRFLLQQLEFTEQKAQILSTMTNVLIPLIVRNPYKLKMVRQLDRDLSVALLGSIHGDVMAELDRQGNRMATAHFMEYLAGKGITDSCIYTWLISYYASENRLRELTIFLRNNHLYSAATIGKWCEECSDPRITPVALITYEERKLDGDYIRVSNKFGYFLEQARYLLKRRSKNLWQRVLDRSNPKRDSLVRALLHLQVQDTPVSNFAHITMLLTVMGNTDLISQTQAIIHNLLKRSLRCNNDQIKSLQRFSVQCLVNSQLLENEIDQTYGDQLSTYDPTITGAVFVEGKMLELAKKMFVQGKYWRDAVHVQVQLSQGSQDFLAVKELAIMSGDPGLLAEVGKICLDNGQLNYAIQCFLDSKCFTYQEEICLLAQKDDANCEWNLLIRFLEGAQPIKKSGCIMVTLALAYGRAHRLADLDKLLTGGTGSAASPDADANLCRICVDSPKQNGICAMRSPSHL